MHAAPETLPLLGDATIPVAGRVRASEQQPLPLTGGKKALFWLSVFTYMLWALIIPNRICSRVAKFDGSMPSELIVLIIISSWLSVANAGYYCRLMSRSSNERDEHKMLCTAGAYLALKTTSFMLPMLACGGLDGLIPVANVVFYANIVGLLGFSAYGIKTGRLSCASADEYAAAGLPKPYKVPNHASLQAFYDAMSISGNIDILYAYYERNKSDTDDALIKTINVIFKIGHEATPGAVDAQPATVVRFKESIEKIKEYLNCAANTFSDEMPKFIYGIADREGYYDHALQIVSAEFYEESIRLTGRSEIRVSTVLAGTITIADLRNPSANWLELCQAVHEAMPEINRALRPHDPTFGRTALSVMPIASGGGGGSEPERR